MRVLCMVLVALSFTLGAGEPALAYDNFVGGVCLDKKKAPKKKVIKKSTSKKKVIKKKKAAPKAYYFPNVGSNKRKFKLRSGGSVSYRIAHQEGLKGADRLARTNAAYAGASASIPFFGC